jgi:hypothetical protein
MLPCLGVALPPVVGITPLPAFAGGIGGCPILLLTVIRGVCGGGGGGDVLGDVLGVLFGTAGIPLLDCRGSGVIGNLPNSSLSIIH